MPSPVSTGTAQDISVKAQSGGLPVDDQPSRTVGHLALARPPPSHREPAHQMPRAHQGLTQTSLSRHSLT